MQKTNYKNSKTNIFQKLFPSWLSLFIGQLSTAILISSGVAEGITGPLMGPQAKNELEVVASKLDHVTKTLEAIETRQEERYQEAQEDEINSIIGSKIFWGALGITALLLFGLYVAGGSGGDEGFFTDLSGNLGDSVSNVGRYLNQDIAENIRISNDLNVKNFEALGVRIDKVEENTVKVCQSLIRSIQRQNDPRLSTRDFFRRDGYTSVDET